MSARGKQANCNHKWAVLGRGGFKCALCGVNAIAPRVLDTDDKVAEAIVIADTMIGTSCSIRSDPNRTGRHVEIVCSPEVFDLVLKRVK